MSCRRSAAACITSFLLFTVDAHAQFPNDPFKVNTSTASERGRYWLPDVELPAVPMPEQTSRLPPGFEGPLSLAQLTDLALQLNPRTRQSWAQARADAAAVGIEQADLMPQVSSLIGFSRARSIAQSGVAVPVQNRYGPTLTLSYILFDFGAQANEVEAARYRLLASNLTHNRILQDVAFQVEQAYYRRLGFEQLVDTSRESLKAFETGLDVALQRQRAGLAVGGDVYRSETALGQARLALQRNEGERDKSRAALKNTIGLQASVALSLEPWTPRVDMRSVSESIEAFMARARTGRPDLIAAEARARAAHASARAASNAGKPSLEVTATAGRTLFTDDRPGANGYGVGLNVRIPLFTGFRDTYSVQRARSVAEQAEGARDQLALQAEFDVSQAYYDLQTAAVGIANNASLLRSASESAASAVARYRAGVGALLDMITAQVDEANVRVQTIQTQLDWHLALSRLAFAIGGADERLGVSR